MIVHLAEATQNNMCNALVDAIDLGATAGVIKVYSGAMPATPDTAISSQVLLATLTFSTTAFGDSVSGVATANAIDADPLIDNTGTATWARIEDGDGDVVADIDVNTSGAALNLNTTALVANGEINVTSFTFTVPNGV